MPSSAEPMSRMRIGAPFTVATTRSLKACGIDDASHGAQDFFPRAAGDVAAGNVGVLSLDGVAHRGDRNLVGRQPVRVDPHIDRAVQVADQAHLADPGRAFELHLDDLVGNLRQFAQRSVAGDCYRKDRRVFVIELRNDGRIDIVTANG